MSGITKQPYVGVRNPNTSNIVPFAYVSNVSSFSVTCQNLTLYKSAMFAIQSYDINNEVVQVNYMTLSEEEYLEWNNNDTYIVDLAASKLGYTLTS
jgi:hypothetical protein